MHRLLASGFLAGAKSPLGLALLVSRRFHVTHPDMAKAALVLHGCGVYDGTEVHEASACLVHLSRAGAAVQCFAPDIDQMHTIDHTKGEKMEPNRNVLKESARIARGDVKNLAELKAADYDLVVFPGGFGAAKNLSDWAVNEGTCTINSDVERTIKEFHSSKKPIALCCISPVLAAKVIPGCSVTVGSSDEASGKWPYAGTVGGVESVGAKHVEKAVNECHVDEENKIVTAPAFMYGDSSQGWNSLHLIFDGVGHMINSALKLVK